MTHTEDMIAETQRAWAEVLGRPVSRDEAEHILDQFQQLAVVMRDILHSPKFEWDLRPSTEGGDIEVDDET